MKSLDRFSIVVDSNEFYHANTWTFPGFSVSVKPLLKYGCDYSIRGLVGTVGVERKSYDDYVRCIGVDWTRFQKQLKKLQKNKHYCVIVEGSFDTEVSKYSKMPQEAILTRTAQITAIGVPVLFACGVAKAQLLCVRYMHSIIRKIQDGV